MLAIRITNLSEPDVVALIQLHLAEMHEASPPGTDHALDESGLNKAGIDVYAAWDSMGNGAQLLAIGALKRHDGFGEIKSMRAHPDARGTGAGKAMLEHLIDRARELGFGAIKLETGSGPAFEAALALYRRRGFVPCEPFADYVPGEFNQLFALEL